MYGIPEELDIIRHAVSVCSGLLSIIGSSAILFKIIRGIETAMPYDRVMLGMSACDILATIAIMLDNFLVPSDLSPMLVSFGNATSCQVIGFLGALSIQWAVWYNAMLSYYFLLTALSQLRRKDYVHKFELWLHLPGIYFPIISIIGLIRGWYGADQVGMSCGITNLKLLLLFGGLPFCFSFLSMIINYSVIYAAVVRKSRQSNGSSRNAASPALVQKRLRREATTLMALYVGSFLIVWTPFLVLSLLGLKARDYTANDGYPLAILVSITLPLQGFFNAIIYLKPAYTRFRAANPNKPMRFILHQALFNPKIPQLSESDDTNTATGRDPAVTVIDPSAVRVTADRRMSITGINFESNFFLEESVSGEDDDSSDSSA